MIYYFTGTGNSAWIARQLARQLDDQTQNISDYLQNDEQIILPEGQDCGIVFPVYAWSPPPVVEDFVKRLRMKDNTYCYTVCCCGDESGVAIDRIKKQIPLSAGWALQMPNNYIFGFSVDTDDVAKAKVDQARLDIKDIAAIVQSKNNVFYDILDNKSAAFAKIASWGMTTFLRKGKKFSVNDSCNSCGICEKHCPVANIKIIDGLPKWSNHCCQCTSCLNRCPLVAIEYGNATAGKERYHPFF